MSLRACSTGRPSTGEGNAEVVQDEGLSESGGGDNRGVNTRPTARALRPRVLTSTSGKSNVRVRRPRRPGRIFWRLKR